MVVEAATAKGPEAAQHILGKLMAGLSGDQIRQCLEFVREWNTNSRRCHAAQATLQAILLQHSPEVRTPEARTPEAYCGRARRRSTAPLHMWHTSSSLQSTVPAGSQALAGLILFNMR